MKYVIKEKRGFLGSVLRIPVPAHAEHPITSIRKNCSTFHLKTYYRNLKNTNKYVLSGIMCINWNKITINLYLKNTLWRTSIIHCVVAQCTYTFNLIAIHSATPWDVRNIWKTSQSAKFNHLTILIPRNFFWCEWGKYYESTRRQLCTMKSLKRRIIMLWQWWLHLMNMRAYYASRFHRSMHARPSEELKVWLSYFYKYFCSAASFCKKAQVHNLECLCWP